MATGRSFAEFVKDKCYDGLTEAAEKYIAEYWQLLDLRLKHVNHIENVEYIDSTIQRVYVSDRPEMKVAFDVGIELDLDVRGVNHRNDESEECFPWIRISCEGNLACGLDDWQITGIEPYNPKNAPYNSLSDTVPQILLQSLRTLEDPSSWGNK